MFGSILHNEDRFGAWNLWLLSPDMQRNNLNDCLLGNPPRFLHAQNRLEAINPLCMPSFCFRLLHRSYYGIGND